MVQSKDVPRTYSPDQHFSDIAAKANTITYEGAALISEGGTAHDVAILLTSGGTPFLGFQVRKVDNRTTSPGPGLENSKRVRYVAKGEIRLTVTGVVATTNPGTVVYATDSETFTLTASGATSIGKFVKWISGTDCMVAFEGAAFRSI